MQAGKISYEDFSRSETKRAANRLRDQWKKDAWVHGGTIDLGEHEIVFQGELHHWNGSRRLAPAILDWLRWKFRRLQIDQSQNEAWALLLRDELPRRVQQAGDPPAGWTEQPPAGAPAWVAGDAPIAGKRVRRDAARVRRELQPRGLPPPLKLTEFDPNEVAKIVSDSSALLGPLFALCSSENERSSLVAALVGYVRCPNQAPQRRRWIRTVQALRSR